MAVEALASGRAANVDPDLLREVRRVEEVALSREALSPVERDLARRYLDLVRARGTMRDEEGR